MAPSTPFTVRLTGPEGADPSAALAQLSSPETDRLALAVFRQRIALIRRRAGARFASGGIGRRIFGERRAGLSKLVKGRVKRERHGLSATLEVTGIPSMIEEGGRTEPHTIKPKLERVLAYETPEGMRYATEVDHPGGRVPADPALGPEIDEQASQLEADIARVYDGHFERATSATTRGRR